MGLFHLPPEIWATIDSHLDDDDRRQLCQTCHDLMRLVQVKVYRFIVLDETAESGRGVLALASGPRARFVRQIQYIPDSPRPISNDEEDSMGSDCRHREVTLSEESREALESLHKFSGLERFRLFLDPEYWALDNWAATPVSLTSHSFDEYHQGHDEEPWRILLEDSFLALSKSVGAFSELELDNLPPIPEQPSYHAFETDGWKKMLQHLTFFDITFGKVGEQGAGCLTIAHQEFIESFPSIFLNHMPRLESLRIVGNEDAAIGHYDNKSPLDWQSLQFPQLRTFEVEYSSLESGLVSFLLNHSKTLEKVYLRHCLAETKSNWRELFEGLIAKRPTQLVDFRIVAYPVPKRQLFRDYDEWLKESTKWIEEAKKARMIADGWEFMDHDDENGGDAGQRILDTINALLGNGSTGGDDASQDADGQDDEGSDSRDDEDGEDDEDDDDSDMASDDGDNDEDESIVNRLDEEIGEEDDEDDASQDSTQWRNIKVYSERDYHWDPVNLDPKARRFVVGETCESYGAIQVADMTLEPNDPELDESDLLEQWAKVEELLESNKVAQSVHKA
ncbi:hypothetical protein HJFPF1_07719 [Paramyrothecium foliicola]|nr:hypothetical protein HJFPF1_07719 [Paramyrothecium foliicola]